MNQHWELLLNDTSEMVAEWKVGGRWSKSLSWVLLSETQLTAWLIFYQLIRIRFKPLTSPSHYQSPTHHHDIGLKFGFSILKGLFPEWEGRLTGSATDLKVGCKIWLGGCLLIFSSLAHMRWSSFCQIYGYIMREKKYQEQLNGKKNPVNNIIIIIITNHNWKRGKISGLHWQHFKRGPKWQSRNMSLYHQTRHHHQCHRHHCYQHHHHQQHCHQYQQYHHRQQQHPRK